MPSLKFVEGEAQALALDLVAFKRARDIVQRRIMQSEGTERFQRLVEWSGTSAVTGSLDLVIHATERTLEEVLVELHGMKEKADDEE